MRWLLFLKIMNGQQIEKLVKELVKKEVDYRSYDGKMSKTSLIERGSETILEQIIRQHILDNRDERIGTLEAKIFVYEEMINKSTFAPMLIEKEVEIVKEPEPYQREMIFTQRQIEHLQHKVFEITGEGEVMKLFNEMLGVSVG
jgi:hypothetical protein